MTTNPFAGPAAAGGGIQWGDLLGRLLLIEPTKFETGVVTSLGEKDAVRADITVIDADGGAQSHPDTLIFPRVLISQTRSLVGEKVLGRLAQGQAKPGQNAPWRIEDATEADIELGVAYLESRETQKPANPFASADTAQAPF